MMITVHGTCIAIKGQGVLMRGPSGSGKSDLALRLIDRGAELVADDQVMIDTTAETLTAQAPATLAGLIEVRGIGVLRLNARPSTRLTLLIDLAPAAAIERMPAPKTEIFCGKPLHQAQLTPFESSAPVKLEWLAAIAAGQCAVLR